MEKAFLFITMAAALLFTQCRKQETTPAAPSADTIRMTITAGPGAKTDIANDGSITWSEGDKLYVSDGEKWLGCLTLDKGAGASNGTFTGDISEISDGTTCHFFYLGKGNEMTELSGSNDVSISFASQDGSKEGALKYHLGHGTAKVTVSGGEATGAVTMRTEIAMAHLKLKMDGADYKGAVTMDVNNTMTVTPGGSFSGGGEGGIDIGGGNTGDRYVTLIPTETTDKVDVSFSGSATGSLEFGQGIQANNLYGMANGIEVTLTKVSVLPGEFSVSSTTTVKFSPGNLYYNGASKTSKMNQNLPSGWNFYENQYDCYPSGTSSATTSMEINLFTWGYGNWSTTYNTTIYQSGNTMTDWGTAPGLPSAGEGKTWRTPSKDEWGYLMNTRTTSTINGVANARYAEVKVNGVCGMMLFPDTFTWPSDVTSKPSTFNKYQSNWNNVNYTTDDFGKLESAGVVFLPAAGNRSGSSVNNVGSHGRYWSSTHFYESYAYHMFFNSGGVNPQGDNYRNDGVSVRLVR